MTVDQQHPLRQICCSILASHQAIVIRGANKEDTLPLMKLKQSCCPLASKASHWPPVSSTGGSSDEGGEGFVFLVIVYTGSGLNLGLEQLGAVRKSANDWPRFSPDLARISAITRMCPSWMFARVQAWWGSGGQRVVIWAAMHGQLGQMQFFKRE